MIKVNRTTKPTVLQKYEKKWVRKIQASLQSGSKRELELAVNKYQHKDIKAQLLKIFLGRCAYCESKYAHVDFGDIEHFRPKAKYPLLAVKWSNLLLACPLCNINKLDKFPKPKLINPCVDNPTNHFSFNYDEYIGIANVSGITPRGVITEQILQLNRYELIRHRSSHIRKLFALAKFHAEYNNVEAKTLLDQALDESNPDSEYLAFAKVIKEKYQ